MRSPFASTTAFLAGTLAATSVSTGWRIDGGDLLRPLVLLAAVSLTAALVLRAVARTFFERDETRPYEVVIATLASLTTATSWAQFWILDLHRARFALVLLALPATVAVLACLRGAAIRREPILWGALGLSAVIVASAVAAAYHRGGALGLGALLPIAIGSAGVLLAVVVAQGTRPLRRASLERIPAEIAPAGAAAMWTMAPRVISAGMFLGLAPVWAAMLGRSGGCGGLSHSFESAQVITTFALFGAGPFVSSVLLERD